MPVTPHVIINHPDFPGMLLLHMLRSEAFMQKAASRIQVTDFNATTERAVMLGTSIALDFWTQYRQLVSQDAFIIQMGSRLAADPGFLTEMETLELSRLVVEAYRTEEAQLTPQFMLDQFQAFVYERRLRPLAYAITTAQPHNMLGLVEDIQNVKAAATASSGRVVNLFEPGREQMNTRPRTPSGVYFLDHLMGGGIALGEVVGLLGPFGKGKTTLAIQLACEFARNRQYTTYLSYETDIVPGVSNRMYGYIGGMSRARLQGKQLHELDPADLERLRAEEEAWAREYLIPVDMKQGSINAGSGGAGEVRAFLREMRDAGKPPKLVILDQYLPMINRYMAARNIKEEQTRIVMQRMVQDFMDIAGEEQCCIVLLHQTSTQKVNASATRKPEAGDSAEAKSFPFWLSTCLGLGTHDGNNRQWLTIIKGRDLAVDSVVIELDGENYRYKWDKDNPNRFRPGANGFVDTLSVSDDVSVGIDKSYDGQSAPPPAPQATHGPEVAY